MTEQTPNEPRDLDAEIEWAVWMLTGTRNGKRVPLADFTRDRMVALLNALRVRPTLDRETIATTLFAAASRDDWGAANELERDEFYDMADVILAALGQDTPEPEWTDPKPFVGIVTGRRYSHRENQPPSTLVEHKPRTRAQYDAEQDS